MTTPAIIYPAFVQMLITFLLCIWMGKLRIREMKAGKVKRQHVLERSADWSDKTRRVELAYYNQFQVPLLFYVGCLFAIFFGQGGIVMVSLAWLFVLFRLIQIYAHTIANNLKLRFTAFLCGFLTVVGMWLVVLLRILVYAS